MRDCRICNQDRAASPDTRLQAMMQELINVCLSCTAKYSKLLQM